MRQRPPLAWGTPDTLEGRADARLSRYLIRTLGLQAGDSIDLICGDGKIHEAVLAVAEPGQVRLDFTGVRQGGADPTLEVMLYVGALKGEQMGPLVQHTTELGVSAIVPVETEGSVPRLPFRQAPRWQQTAWDSAITAGRTTVPHVHSGMGFEEAVSTAVQRGLVLVCLERSQSVSDFRSALAHRASGPVSIFVGPENGFSPAEVSLVRSSGIEPCTLGPRMLRALSAAIAAVTIVLHELDELGSVSA